ncbi:transmembrane protein 222, partial [Paragonimus westermani]
PRHRNEAVDSLAKTMHSKHLDRIEIVGLPAVLPSIDSAVKPSWHRFPHSLVWTPIPLLTWLFPIIGHMGITNASGIIYDFAAPYTICEDNMGFGWPTMYCQLDMNLAGGQEQWDKAVYKANEVYKLRMHNLFCDNCYCHVALALSSMQYLGRSNWNMIRVALFFLTHARYVRRINILRIFLIVSAVLLFSKKHLIATWLPFLLIFGVIFVVLTVIILH